MVRMYATSILIDIQNGIYRFTRYIGQIGKLEFSLHKTSDSYKFCYLAYILLAWPSQEFGGELALLMAYGPVGIKETKKKKNIHIYYAANIG